MIQRQIPLESLVINAANDRHGELENETAAIAWLFNNKEQHMKNLTRDIVKEKQIYEPPLVWKSNDKYIVYDGNRRVTCLKLLKDSRRAPTIELRKFFDDLGKSLKGDFLEKIPCRVETDRDRIDEILFRRHTGVQNGVGQSTWDDRMKFNFVTRTGKGSGVNVADEIESRLDEARQLPKKRKVPRSTLNRLFSAEAMRNRVGFSIKKGRFEYTHDPRVVLRVLARIADDLANRRIVLNDVWDTDGKREYLNKLDAESMLPTAAHIIEGKKEPSPTPPPRPTPTPTPTPTTTTKPSEQKTLIPHVDYAIAWAGRLQRHRAIWEELQFYLELERHPNAISVLLRVLIEISIENYIKQSCLATIRENDSLAKKAVSVAKDLHSKGKIDRKYFQSINKITNYESVVSMDTLNRYVHSPEFAPSSSHLKSIWTTLGPLIVECLNI